VNNNQETTLLEVDNLKVTIKDKKRPLHPVRGVSFSVDQGQRVCLVGESGCGKTMTAFSILRLLPEDQFSISGGIFFDKINILSLAQEEMRKIRGHQIAMVFQEPMTALNPVLSIGFQIVEAIRVHKPIPKKEAIDLALSVMTNVGIPNPNLLYNQYPHQLSGGLRQRVMIAMALSCNPRLLIADEPTTALDVTVQAQILELICLLSTEMDLALVLITHNLGVVAQIAQRVLVMYAGSIVEDAPARELFNSPLHPYTKGLIASVPYGKDKMSKRRLSSIPGRVPALHEIPQGCAFRDRCKWAQNICSEKAPELRRVNGKQKVACHLVNV